MLVKLELGVGSATDSQDESQAPEEEGNVGVKCQFLKPRPYPALQDECHSSARDFTSGALGSELDSKGC